MSLLEWVGDLRKLTAILRRLVKGYLAKALAGAAFPIAATGSQWENG